MTSPYSGATPVGNTPVGNPPGYGEPQANYAVTPDQYGAHSGGTPVAGNLGTPTTADGRPDVDGTSVGELMGEVAKDLSTLMRQELELAKAEVKAEATKAGKGAGLMGAAGFAGYMVLLFLSIALWWALENVMDAGLAALIVAVVWAVIGGVAFVLGRSQLKKVNPKPERTVDTLSQVPGALKPN